MNLNRLHLLFLATFLINAFSSYAFYTHRECIRFSPLKMQVERYFYGPSTLESKDWIDISVEIGRHTFSVNIPALLQNSTETFFYGIYPAPGTGGMPDDWPEHGGYIVCQWDEQNESNLTPEVSISGVLLRTPYNCSVDSNDDSHNDIDIYCFTPENKAYCFELEADSNVKIAIGTSKSNLVPLQFEKCYTGYGVETAQIKRSYKIDFVPMTKYYVVVYGDPANNIYYDIDHSYKVTIKKARPMILVHGIGAKPRGAVLSDKAFGEIPEKFPYLLEVQPTYVFEFPWDSNNRLYTEYCGNGLTQLYGYVNEHSDDWPLAPTIIAHSMGGILIVKQIEYNANLLSDTHSFIFFGTPFCGSDSVNRWGVGLATHTSEENIAALKRGNPEHWNLLKSIPSALFSKSSFVISKKDGCVSKSSANLPKTMDKSSDYLFISLGHSDMKWLKFPCKGEKKQVLDLIKRKVKIEDND